MLCRVGLNWTECDRQVKIVYVTGSQVYNNSAGGKESHVLSVVKLAACDRELN